MKQQWRAVGDGSVELETPVRFRAVVLACGFVVLASAAAAQDATTGKVTTEDKCHFLAVGPACSFTIYISGAIDQITLERVRLGLAENTKDRPLNVRLNSPGGSTDAAMQIGRMLRVAEANVLVRSRAECASACVFLLAGAVDRHIEGRIGIHRPYFEVGPDGATKALVKTNYDRLVADIRAYLKEMNVTDRLLEEMLVVPPEQVRYLTSREIGNFGLDQTDPVVAETRALRSAEKYGLTRQEYMLRRERAKEECKGSGLQSPTCWEAIMSGNR